MEIRYPEALILTQPIWQLPNDYTHPNEVARGPFVFERTMPNGKTVKLVGMRLAIEGTNNLLFSDGERMRYYGFDSIEVDGDKVIYQAGQEKFVIRPIELKDAAILFVDPNRAGLTKEDLINEALRVFQPRV